MSVKTIYRLSGYLSVVMGLLSALSVVRKEFLFYGIPLAIVGFLFSGLNIILNAKYEYEGDKHPRGYWGLFLSSLPVVFFLVLMNRSGQGSAG